MARWIRNLFTARQANTRLGSPKGLRSRLTLQRLEQRDVPTTFTVLNAADSGAGSIRQAILDANTAAGADSIVFDATFFALPRTIQLSTGLLRVNGGLTITGPGSTKLTIDGQGLSNIVTFDAIGSSYAVNLSGLKLVNGRNTGGVGGGIAMTDALMTLTDVTISGCTATRGGGIDVQSIAATLTLNNCTLSNNTANSTLLGYGGGISLPLDTSGTASNVVVITNSTFSGNSAAINGGAISARNAGTLTMTGCTVSGNQGNSGGGINLSGTNATITNCTISSNSATLTGGGIYDANPSKLAVAFSTIAYNSSPQAGGIYIANGSTLNLNSTIVANNNAPSGTDIIGIVASSTYNLIGNSAGATGITDPTNKLNVAVYLNPLANNGGPTQTHSLLGCSPAINSGNPVGPATDQCGVARLAYSANDIGAFEVNSGYANAGSTIWRTAGNKPQTVTVIYSDLTGIKVSSLGTGDITVSGPGGFTATPTFVSVDNNTNGTPRVATYSFTPPGGSWNTADDGSYTYQLVANQVSKTGGTFIAASTIGFLSVGVVPPVAVASSTAFLAAKSQTVTVHYTDATAIDVSTLGTGDISISGPGGFTATPTFVSVDDNTNGSQRDATYVFTPPGGFWDGSHNGSYTIQIVDNQVSNTNGAFIGAATIGAFQVWLPYATSPIVTVAGGMTQSVTVTYSGPTPINTFTIGNGDITISGPGGFTAAPTFVSVDNITNGTPRVATYSFFAPGGTWNVADNGTYTITLAGSAVANTSGVYFTAGPIGTFEVNVPAVLTVTNTADSGTGSLRDCIAVSNAVAGSDTIVFDAAVFATPQTIKLSTGSLGITGALTITGPGSAKVTIDGQNMGGILSIVTTGIAQVNFSGMSLINGKNSSGGGGIYFQDDALTLTDVNISGCTATYGGGIAVSAVLATLTLNNCTLSNNYTTGDGGGISLPSDTTNSVGTVVVITDSAFSGNSAVSSGGGINHRNQGSLTVSRSTFTGNTCGGRGGAISVAYGSATITNCTISGNSASFSSGGIDTDNKSKVMVAFSTIAYNSSPQGGGFRIANSGTLNLNSTIVSSNLAPSGPDIAGAVASASDSLVSKTIDSTGITAPTNKLNVSALLNPLANNGGTTLTHTFASGSPALNNGNPSGPATDQRGVARPLGTSNDIGAVEFQPPATVTKIDVNGGAVQRSLVTQVAVTFSSQVTFTGLPGDAFTLVHQGDNAPVTTKAAVDNSGAGTIVTLTFTGGAVNGTSLADGRFNLTILANKFASSGLDGNGDGTAGDNYQMVGDPATNKLFRLYGDADGNGIVDQADFIVFRSAFNAGPSAAFDFDGDGQVSQADFIQFRSRFNLTV